MHGTSYFCSVLRSMDFLQKWKDKGILIVIFVIGFNIAFIRLFQSDYSRIPGDLGDSRLNNYFLEHGYQFVTGKTASFWDAPFMFPDKQALTWSDNHLGTLPIYVLGRWIGLDRETSYQFWISVIVLLNFISVAYCFYKLKFRTELISIGAYLFTFSIIAVSKIGHSQLLATFYIPWIYYCAFQFYRKFEIRYLFYSALFIELQFYCSIYLGFLSFIPLLFIVTLIIILKWRIILYNIKAYKFNIQIVLWPLALLIFILPLAWPYYQRSLDTGYKDYDSVIPLLLSFRNFIMPADGMMLWKKLEFFNHNVDVFWEKQLFVGLTITGLFFIYFVNRIIGTFRSRSWNFILFSTIILSILLMVNWGNGFSFYKYFREIPGFSSMRPIGRIIIPLLFLGIWLSLILIRKFNIKYGFELKLFIPLFIFIVLDQSLNKSSCISRSHSKVESRQGIDSLVQKIKLAQTQSSKNYLAVAYMPDVKKNAVELQIQAALAAQECQIPSVNGYSSSCRGEFGRFWDNYDTASLKIWLDYSNVKIEDILIIK